MYATYRRIETFDDVPPAGPLDAKVRESHRLDFKETASPDKTAEHAKDMATFANGFGGVILIGSSSKDGIVEHRGISRKHAASMAEVYEQVAKDMCSPVPVIMPIIIAMPASTNVLLAVNVDPAIEGPVGSRSAKEQDAWLFPMREGSHTKYLKPHELPMYMNPKLRRTLLLLDRIQDGTSVLLWYDAINRDNPLLAQGNGAKGAADLTTNSIPFSVTIRGRPETPVRVPVTEIEEVWQAHDGKWNLRVSGHINVANNEVMFMPVAR